MPHVIDVVRVWGEDEDKEHNDDRDENQLAFQETADNVEPAPVEDYVADNGPDYAVEAGGGARLDDVL
jgi:hypothetical protein